MQIDENNLRKIIREEIREGVEAITSQKFDEINGKFTEINGKFDEVNSKFTEVRGRFDEINDRFDHVDKRLDNIEDDVAEIRLQQSITDKKLDAVIDEFKDHEERLTKVEKVVDKYR
jgi:phage-related tail protein